MNLTEDRSPILRIVDIIFLALAVVTYLLRVYTRWFIVRAFGLDDWLMAVAVIFYSLYVTSGLISAAHGTGRHQYTLSNDDRYTALLHWWLCYIWYALTMAFARGSIGIFFLRLTVKRIHVYLIWLVMVSTVVFGIICIGVGAGECTPAAYFWDKTIKGGHCMDGRIITTLMYLYSSSALFSDATFAIFPVFLILGLQMDRRTKIALIPVLGLGWIASLAVIIRFAFLYTFASPDLTYDAIVIAILSSTEQGLAITAGNLCTLRPLFTRTFGSWSSNGGGASHDIVNNHQMHPPTIGAIGRAKGRAPSNEASVDLDTFSYPDSDDVERGSSAGNGAKEPRVIEVTTDISSKSQSKRSRIWSTSRSRHDSDNESQEGLHANPSRDTLADHIQAVPKSFLTRGDGAGSSDLGFK